MNQYNYPTIILSGQGALAEFVNRLKAKAHERILIVTDETLKACGLLESLTSLLDARQIAYSVFSETHPNPVEEDVTKGTAVYKDNQCDSIIAFGGGSPMDLSLGMYLFGSTPCFTLNACFRV